MKIPLIIINFKTYPESTGKKALRLAKKIQRVNKNMIIGVQATDIYLVSKNTKLSVYAQHVDSYKQGRNTGFITPESVKQAGAGGVFLNHSEHKLSLIEIKKIFKRCKKINLKVAIFSKNIKEAKQIEKLKPDYLIIEPPELVGGNISISKAKPKLIENISKNLKIPFLVGAGIKTSEDVKIAMKLGASGIAIASGIIKVKDSKKALKDLIKL